MGHNGKLQIRVARKGQGLGGVYVGRPTPLGNPFRLEKEDQREEVVARYATWLEEELHRGNREVARGPRGALPPAQAPRNAHPPLLLRPSGGATARSSPST
jgi:hypothetical protein